MIRVICLVARYYTFLPLCVKIYNFKVEKYYKMRKLKQHQNINIAYVKHGSSVSRVWQPYLTALTLFTLFCACGCVFTFSRDFQLNYIDSSFTGWCLLSRLVRMLNTRARNNDHSRPPPKDCALKVMVEKASEKCFRARKLENAVKEDFTLET